MQDLSGMISPDIVPKSVVILHTKSCKIIEVFNPRSCLCDLTGIILRDLSRLFRHDLSGYSSKIHCDLACKILQDQGSYCFKILQEFFLGWGHEWDRLKVGSDWDREKVGHEWDREKVGS